LVLHNLNKYNVPDAIPEKSETEEFEIKNQSSGEMFKHLIASNSQSGSFHLN
jgi:hypothetical protein